MSQLPKSLYVTAAAVLLTAAVAAGPAAPATRPAAATTRPATALEAARAYTDQMKAGHAAEAFEPAWDLDAAFDAAFGNAMKGVSAEDRVEMRRQFVDLTKGTLSIPAVARLMQTATYDGFTAAAPTADGKTAVSFDVTMATGKAIPNTLTYAKSADVDWKIVGSSNNGKGMVDGLKVGYDGFAANQPGATPVQFIKLVAESAKRKRAQDFPQQQPRP